MKSICLIFPFFIVLVSCKENTPLLEEEAVSVQQPVELITPEFLSGRWEAPESGGFTFDVWLYVEDGFISGQYCAMNEDVSRIDCGTEGDLDDCFIRGSFIPDKNSIEVTIKSCYALKEGKAVISRSGNYLIWHLAEPPGKYGQDHFAPEGATLKKVGNKVF